MSLEQVIAENTAAIRELIAALGKTGVAVPKAAEAKKQEAAPAASTAPVATQPTAEASAVQDTKAPQSAPAKVELLSADELASAVKNAIAKVGRDPVVALLTEFGVKKAGEVATEKRADFDAKLIALAA